VLDFKERMTTKEEEAVKVQSKVENIMNELEEESHLR
jgi:hypothetical protein